MLGVPIVQAESRVRFNTCQDPSQLSNGIMGTLWPLGLASNEFFVEEGCDPQFWAEQQHTPQCICDVLRN